MSDLISRAEEVREALMRLTMCAREECDMCKHKDECGFEFQYNISTENMHTILDALSADAVPHGRLIDADALIAKYKKIDITDYPDELVEVVEAVIRDIEGEPTFEAVSRDVYDKRTQEDERIIDSYRQEFQKALSAEAVQGWRIGKPTEQGEYMVTLDSFGHKRIDLFYYGRPLMPNRKVRGKCWFRSDDEWGDVVYDDTDILAWMPLPTPYKGGDRE